MVEPFGVGATIDINMYDFAILKSVGVTVTVNRGYKGIFVRRVSYNEFVAFECACSNDHEECLMPFEGWDGAVLESPSCKSKYETLDGH